MDDATARVIMGTIFWVFVIPLVVKGFKKLFGIVDKPLGPGDPDPAFPRDPPQVEILPPQKVIEPPR